MESDKKFTDEQLNALLRDVSVPNDLHAELLRIPELQNESRKTPHVVSKPEQSSRPIFRMVLAASLLGIAAFLTWFVMQQRTDGPGPIAEIDKVNGLVDDLTVDKRTDQNASPVDDQPAQQLAAMDATVELLEQEIHRMEMSAMQEELRLLQERQSSSELNELEVDSMIIALSSQASLPLGNSRENVEQKMVRVIQQFPGSRGAQIAQDFIDQIEH